MQLAISQSRVIVDHDGLHRPMLSSGQISFLGLGKQTDFEAEVITDRGLPVVDVQSDAQ